MNTKEEKNKILADKNSAANATAESAQKAALGGVDKQYTDKMNSTYTPSNAQTQAQGKASNQLMNYENIANKDSIVSGSTWNAINQNFKTPTAVTEADAYLKGALSKIQNGKTSYSDSIREMMDKITNRDKFAYDVDNDPLFQQALASAMNSGKSAMQDTIGQASALTGGYGSSYATSAGNQAYNAFIEDAYDNLPQYYQMALDAYNAEGDELYRQLDMFNTADEKEYGRMLNAYDATGTYRDRLYNEAYQQFRDSKSDAFASANLQISEHGQLSNDAFNLYNAYANEADKMYEREYQKWSDEVDNAMQMAGMQNADYWKQKDYEQTDKHFYEGLEHESAENALDRTHQSTENALDREHDSTENQKNRDWQTEESQKDRDWKSEESALDRAWQSEESQKDRNWKSAESQKDRNQSSYEFAITHGDTNGDGKLSADEIAAYNAQEKKAAQQGLGLSDKEYDKFMETLETKGEDAAFDYLDLIGKAPVGDEQENVVMGLVTRHNDGKDASAATLDWNSVEIRKTTDTTNGGWGLDHNDEFYVNGDIMTLDDIDKKLQEEGWSDTKRKSFLKSLTGIKKDEIYSFNGGLKKK